MKLGCSQLRFQIKTKKLAKGLERCKISVLYVPNIWGFDARDDASSSPIRRSVIMEIRLQPLLTILTVWCKVALEIWCFNLLSCEKFVWDPDSSLDQNWSFVIKPSLKLGGSSRCNYMLWLPTLLKCGVLVEWGGNIVRVKFFLM
jgi:hypothetical protein